MIISILQLNINSDNHWEKLIQYLKISNHDIIMLQEITGPGTVCGNINSKLDCFKELNKLLDSVYNGELTISNIFTSSPDSYSGNAIFYKKQFTLLEKKIVTLNKRQSPFPSEADSFEDLGRDLLHISLSVNYRPVSFLTTHAAWAKSPEEHSYQTEQGEILFAYLKTVSAPFILGGDFNLDPEQPLIKKISSISRNLIFENNITNTLNPRIHRKKNLFPKGFAVDYIFISHDLSPVEFLVIDKDLSDHFGVSVKIEI